MQTAVTLVHKAAMGIAVHAISSFARHFHGSHRLEIHTDGSPDEADQAGLLRAAAGIETNIVTPAARASVLNERLQLYPKTRALLNGVGYNAKLELPMVLEPPYFYFDSDIVWLRPVSNLAPTNAPNAFSTESWSWYNGVSNDREWIRAKTPRRVNSGFYFSGEPFPFDRMEDMLAKAMFDPTIRYNTDQEIMAYLYRNMELFHIEDFKRSRRATRYDLATDPAAALHFPGGMWREHLDQMEALRSHVGRPAMDIRYQPPVPLDAAELFRMRMNVRLSDSPLLRGLVDRLRTLRRHLAV